MNDTMTRNQEIAQTILAQLGGRRFIAMTGGRDFVAVRDGLRFRIPGRGINSVTVRLDDSDTYTVEFHSIRQTTARLVHTAADIYAEDLQRVFTDYTGLDTHL